MLTLLAEKVELKTEGSLQPSLRPDQHDVVPYISAVLACLRNGYDAGGFPHQSATTASAKPVVIEPLAQLP